MHAEIARAEAGGIIREWLDTLRTGEDDPGVKAIVEEWWDRTVAPRIKRPAHSLGRLMGAGHER